MCSPTATKTQIANLDATSAASPISIVVIPSDTAVAYDTDRSFWPPNHSLRAMITIIVTSTQLQKMVYPSPVYSVQVKKELKGQDILSGSNNKSVMKPRASSRSYGELDIEIVQSSLVE